MPENIREMQQQDIQTPEKDKGEGFEIVDKQHLANYYIYAKILM